MTEILIVDDDFVFAEALTASLEDEGFSVRAVETSREARDLLKSRVFAVAFIDVYLPDGNGLDLLSGLALLPEPPEAIVVTARGDPDGAVSAISHGAWDYIQKPTDMEEILLMVRRALAARERKQVRLHRFGVAGIVGESLPMRLSLLQMFEAAQTDTPVLITGETGTGKELVARAVHKNSRRAKEPFVVVDCGSISPTLMESELFGNVRGAFTGAAQSRQGLMLLADGGTLFMDEVGELTLEQQKVFLRVLQERTFRPVGSNEELRSNFRLVAATNRDLNAMAARDAFRPDLLFRLQGSLIALPPLRERGDDVELLAEHGLAGVLARNGMEEKRFSREAMQALKSYSWPGNVRELLHTVEHAALAAADESLILLQHLPLQLRTNAARFRLRGGRGGGQHPPEASAASLPAPPPAAPDGASAEAPPAPSAAVPASAPEASAAAASSPVGTVGASGMPGAPAVPSAGGGVAASGGRPLSWRDFQEQVLMDHRRRYLFDLLSWAEGNIPKAADTAGISRQRLYTLLRDHGITRKWDDEGQ